MKRLSLLLVVVFASTLNAQDTVRIGAWNIEHLGNPRSRAVGEAQEAEDIASYIIASEVDILGLEEITQNLANRRNETIEEALAIVEVETGDEWRHMLFPKSGEHQHIGVAWNTNRATMIGNPVRIQVATSANGQSLWDRRPYGVKFSLGEDATDLVVVVLHMKANRRENNQPNLRRREAEARTLVSRLQGIENTFDDEDIVFIGDTNILRANERTARIFTDAGFTDLNDDDEPTYIGGSDAPFDRAFVPRDQPEFENARQFIFRSDEWDDEEFRELLSDHLMIVVDIRVMDDDD